MNPVPTPWPVAPEEDTTSVVTLTTAGSTWLATAATGSVPDGMAVLPNAVPTAGELLPRSAPVSMVHAVATIASATTPSRTVLRIGRSSIVFEGTSCMRLGGAAGFARARFHRLF